MVLRGMSGAGGAGRGSGGGRPDAVPRAPVGAGRGSGGGRPHAVPRAPVGGPASLADTPTTALPAYTATP